MLRFVFRVWPSPTLTWIGHECGHATLALPSANLANLLATWKLGARIEACCGCGAGNPYYWQCAFLLHPCSTAGALHAPVLGWSALAMSSCRRRSDAAQNATLMPTTLYYFMHTPRSPQQAWSTSCAAACPNVPALLCSASVARICRPPRSNGDRLP